MKFELRCLLPSLAVAITALAFLTASGVGWTQDSSSLLDYPETSLRGLITAETVNSVETCRKLCEARTGCEGFDHVAATNTCRMFASVNGASQSGGSFAAAREPVRGYSSPASAVTSEPPDSRHTNWFHYGSWMTLRLSPNTGGGVEVEIVYDTPKVTLLKIGIRSGSTLFKGSLSGGRLIGKARLTGNHCGIIEYDVEGVFDPWSRVPFVLHGAAPKRRKDCSVEQWEETGDNANLKFTPR
ncbi:PAN domain-containing protein [Rhizobium giardinii]|uniref:PAN domain-containing protein n=1 Tax=Rhizobium giardinii TaxID=56731 RepID=UPI003D6FC25C